MIILLKKLKKNFIVIGLILVMLLNLVYAVNYRTGSNSLAASSETVYRKGFKKVSVGKDGNIVKEENEHFIKYIIYCNKTLKEIKWQQENSFMEIPLNKEDISDISLKGEAEDTNISYKEYNGSFILALKQKFENNNFVYTEKDDEKTLVVLLSKESNPFSHVIVLDAGHGGQDKGANYGDIYEKDINLKIADYAAEKLRFNGFKVVQTRDSDKLLSLKEVGNITNEASGDIFISVHVNENKDSKYNGVTTYYYDPDGLQKEERLKLAKTIQKELVKSDDWTNRGVLRQNFAVLRYSNIPGVLLECGFLSNLEDRGKLVKNDVLKNFAQNITNGVINYFFPEKTNN